MRLKELTKQKAPGEAGSALAINKLQNAGFLLNGSAALSLPGLYSHVKSKPRNLSYQRACRGESCF